MMMWKALLLLTVTSVVLAGRIKKHATEYKFNVIHDYKYGHHKEEHHDHEKKEEQVQNQEKSAEEQLAEENNQEGELNQEQEGQAEQNNEEENQEQAEESNIESNSESNGESNSESNDESQEQENHDKHGFSAYEIMYKVKDPYTHDYKGFHEKKYDDDVKGAYWLLQPDGYKRTVHYHADKHSGFNADVDYAKHEEHHHGEEGQSEEGNEENSDKSDEHYLPKSEYFVSIQHGLKKPTPITEENKEQENQESSAHHFPIYVL